MLRTGGAWCAARDQGSGLKMKAEKGAVRGLGWAVISEQSPRSEGSGCSPTRCSQQGQPKRCLAGVKQPPAGSLQLSWGLQPLLVSSH